MKTLKERMSELRNECFKPFNIVLLGGITENSTNDQIIKAVAQLKNQLYLFFIANEIVIELVCCGCDSSNIEEKINSL